MSGLVVSAMMWERAPEKTRFRDIYRITSFNFQESEEPSLNDVHAKGKGVVKDILVGEVRDHS